MHGFGSDNQLWTEMRTFLAAMASATCFTTYEKATMSALHAAMATSHTLHGHEVDILAGNFRKLLCRWPGSSD